jgi:flagellar basal-body rod modification protein FlgD
MATTVKNSTTGVSQDLLDAVNTRTSTTSTTEEAQNRFMKLLVEQMKNQDPLNPMDNAQVTSQMAQLSTVTGIDKLNETMTTLMTNLNSTFQSSQTYQASSMIGHDVLTAGKTITKTDSSDNKFGFNLPTNATNVTVNIKNNTGTVVRTLELGAVDSGISTLNWDGFKNDGTEAINADYTFEVSYVKGETKGTATALNVAKVTSVSTSSSGVSLNLHNNTSVTLDDIHEIY